MRAIVAGVLAAGLATAAVAAEVSLKPEDVVKARQGGMALVGGVMGDMKAAVESGNADPKTYVGSAEGLVAWAQAYPALFPDGTQNVADTKAKPEIWSDRAGFEKADATFVTASKALVDAAKSGDKAQFAAAFQEEGKACGGCHRNYKNR